MRARISPWLILLLLGVVFSLVPAVLYHDLRSAPAAESERETSVEQRLFAALSVPPSLLTEIGGRGRTAYARLALASEPAAERSELSWPLAVEHAAGAVPFWFVLFVSTWELARFSRKRMREADARRLSRFRLSDPIH